MDLLTFLPSLLSALGGIGAFVALVQLNATNRKIKAEAFVSETNAIKTMVDELQEELRNRERMVDDLSTRLNDVRDRCDERVSGITNKYQAIQLTCHKLQMNTESLENSLRVERGRIEALHEQLTKSNDLIDRLKAALDVANAEIARLRDALDTEVASSEKARRDYDELLALLENRGIIIDEVNGNE